MKTKMRNNILETHPEHYLIDIGTKSYQYTAMLVDHDIFDLYLRQDDFGRIHAKGHYGETSVAAACRQANGLIRAFHHLVLPPKEGFTVRSKVKGNATRVDNRRSNLYYHELTPKGEA
jgi:hypothetical protein